MERAGSRTSFTAAGAGLVAAFGCLQAGIDPVFLTLLSQASRVPLAAHGMIVGGTQAGAALGSLVIWRLGALLPHGAVVGAAAAALLCSLATAFADSFPTVLALRCCYGLAMGMVYAYSMAAYAVHRPNKAYGAVFLIQLLLSTLVSVLLPEIELAIGPEAALATLALVPASALAGLSVMARQARAQPGDAVVPGDLRAPVPAAGWALAAATFWFICSTMLVWSSAAMLATSAGISNRTIGQAVAIGSLVGAMTAVAVMRDRLVVPLPITGLLSGAALASPILLTRPGGDLAFIAAIVLLNIGSTAIIIRCSGLATATSADSRFRVLVACSHTFGLIAGPLLGATMMGLFGADGLLFGALIALPAGLFSIFWAVAANFRRRPETRSGAILPESGPIVRMALD